MCATIASTCSALGGSTIAVSTFGSFTRRSRAGVRLDPGEVEELPERPYSRPRFLRARPKGADLQQMRTQVGSVIGVTLERP